MKKFFLCIIVSLMMIFSGGIPTFAAYDPIPGGTFAFKHYLVMNYRANVPPITFDCSIRPAPASGSIYSGPQGATINNIAYSADMETFRQLQPGDDVMFDDETEKYAKGILTVDLRNARFNAPGTYRYIISGNKTGASDGVSTSEDLYLDVYITHNDTDTALVVSALFLHMTNNTEKVNGITDRYNANDIRLINNVTGAQGDRFKDFKFTLKVDGGQVDKRYLVRVEGMDEQTIVSQQSIEFTLKHAKRARVYGLSPNDKYTITEEDNSGDGYTTSYTINGGNIEERLSTGETVMENRPNEINFYNHKEGGQPVTGIILNRLPYILMIAVAIGFGSVFYFKKRTKLSDK